MHNSKSKKSHKFNYFMAVFEVSDFLTRKIITYGI